MTNILCLETSTDLCSVALAIQEPHQIILREGSQDKSHATEIIVLIQACLEQASLSWADLSAVAVSAGPGSFTGLRVGTATAKAICFAHQLPLISIDTLQCMGTSTRSEHAEHRLVLLHARRKEVYAQLVDFDGNMVGQRRVLDLQERSLTDCTNHLKDVTIFTDCPDLVKPFALDFPVIEVLPHASLLCIPAQSNFKKKVFVDLNSYTPTYVKAPYITTPKKGL